MENISNIHALKRHARPILAGLAAGICFIWVQNAFASPPQSFEKEAKTCSRAIQYQERRTSIPKGLLNAISHAESGRWDALNQATIAWPWTVTTGGKGYFLPNRVDAVAFVKSLQAEGVENIDVGCMQVNLKYHPNAFASITLAFDPNSNATYAADLLVQRYAISKSWLKAAGAYHSTTPELRVAYQKKVAKIWRKNTQATKERNARRMVQSYKKRLLSATIKPFDPTLTQRFNAAFRTRKSKGIGIRPGQVIANRINALRPGANLNRPKGEDQAKAFALKRKSQLMAWRQSTQPTLHLPMIPAPIRVQ